ncbi:MAG: carbamate kinase [Bacillota bacterium]|jgi:carbamate kinase|nr:MAG: carbamate kinase [Bacillota bacterium]
MTSETETIVLALGGNAILQPGQKGTAAEQRQNIAETAEAIVELIKMGHRVIVTHGNGPQVGNILLQNEAGADQVPAMPLDVCGAESQGQLGYMVGQALRNELRANGLPTSVAAVVTQTVVAAGDPAFASPTKPVGPFYPVDRGTTLGAERGWVMKEVRPGQVRRLVPSPDPVRIVERDEIRTLIAGGTIVIASGGGGIPVVEHPDGTLRGVEAVIDKDLAGQRLAADVGASVFIILTDIDRVTLAYGTPEQVPLERMTLSEARDYLEQGHFPPGSMGPKVLAVIRFLEAGGKRAVIAAMKDAARALAGNAGTTVTT